MKSNKNAELSGNMILFVFLKFVILNGVKINL